MGLTGRYDFKGIQKQMGRLIDGLLLMAGWGTWLLASPLKPVVNILRDMLVNFLANQGLIILNIGANIIDGKLDQNALDLALQEGLRRVMQGRDKITEAQGKAIDDRVRKAFDENADLGATDPDKRL